MLRPPPETVHNIAGQEIQGYDKNTLVDNVVIPAWNNKLTNYSTVAPSKIPLVDATLRAFAPTMQAFMGTEASQQIPSDNGIPMYKYGNNVLTVMPAKRDSKTGEYQKGDLVIARNVNGEWKPFADQRPATDIQSQMEGLIRRANAARDQKAQFADSVDAKMMGERQAQIRIKALDDLTKELEDQAAKDLAELRSRGINE